MDNTFGLDIIPHNEKERLASLYRYLAADTYYREGSFKHIAAMAARIFHSSIALISFVDKEQVFFRGNVGMAGTRQLSRGISLCSLAILQQEVTVFEDTKKVPCLLANPLVTGELGLQFYAAAPLTTADGYNIGVVCIADRKARAFSAPEQQLLKGLATAVIDELEEKKRLAR